MAVGNGAVEEATKGIFAEEDVPEDGVAEAGGPDDEAGTGKDIVAGEVDDEGTSVGARTVDGFPTVSVAGAGLPTGITTVAGAV
jgi:hypothetical protein